ncbi:LppU/SCO3897 family protein [Nocardia lasii]|uniref:Pyridine nucleotide-disulfide oxidoreductase n=1 Tax=Nocardia lasii TaxID=1616107 RepID=A0ABW1JSC0_9NOCA
MKFTGKGTVSRFSLALLAVAALGAAGCSAVDKVADVAKDASKSDTARSKVGECINVISASVVDSKTEPVACSADNAVYQVVQVHDKKVECHEDYTSYEETFGSGGTVAFLCLVPNFKEGSCYNEGMMTGYKYVACTAPDASFKVVTRVDGQVDDQLCGEDADQVLVIHEPKITYCVSSSTT